MNKTTQTTIKIQDKIKRHTQDNIKANKSSPKWRTKLRENGLALRMQISDDKFKE